MLSRIIAFTLLISMSAFAADECDPLTVDQNVIRDLSNVASRMKTECPNSIHVGNFCAAVESQAIELEPKHDSVMYQYQTLIYDASCVESGDSEVSIKAKVQNFWNRYHDALLCKPVNFVPQNGNILKLAVSRQSDPFIDDSIRNWGVGLNHVDVADKSTVLDYIERKKKEAGSNSNLVRTYQRYYDRFRTAGAKHKREL